MKFGLLYDFRNPERWRRESARFYSMLLDQAQAAEALGYDSVWVSEHHFVEDDYCPSVFSLLSAIASRTRRVALGSHVLLLPLHHPLRVAEDAATVDILSNGRLILGVAAGYRREEFAGFQAPLAERGSRMDEAIAILSRAWTEDRVSFAGRHFQFHDVAVRPQPVQPGGIPIWIGARGGRAIDRAARLGLPLLAAGGVGYSRYLDALVRHGRDPSRAVVGVQWPVYVAEDERQAWDDVKERLLYMENSYAAWFQEAGDLARDRTLKSDRRVEDLPRERYCIGDPASVRERIERLAAEMRVDTLIMRMQFPGLDPAKSARSMELFARQVAPYVHAEPVTL